MPTDDVRGIALALRDLVEQTGATKGTLAIAGTTITASAKGVYLAVNGEVHNLTDWVDYTGALPV